MTSIRSLFVALSLLLALASPMAAQAKKDLPIEPGVAALVNGQEISEDDYKDFLYQRMGKRPLQNLVDFVLVQQAAERFGVTADGGAVQKIVDERYEQARRGQNPEDFAKGIQESGLAPASFMANLRQDATQEVLLNGLVLATRILSDAYLQKAFESQYGVNGKKVVVRQVLVMPHFLRADLIRNGIKPADIDQTAVRAQAAGLAQECLEKLRSGADWSEMVQSYSHDQVSKKSNGELPAYRPGLYGPKFTEAVTTLPVGDFSEVIESGAGYHVVQVASRAETKFEDVRAALVEQARVAAPDWSEREDLLNSLRNQAEIKLW